MYWRGCEVEYRIIDLRARLVEQTIVEWMRRYVLRAKDYGQHLIGADHHNFQPVIVAPGGIDSRLEMRSWKFDDLGISRLIKYFRLDLDAGNGKISVKEER